MDALFPGRPQVDAVTGTVDASVWAVEVAASPDPGAPLPDEEEPRAGDSNAC